MNKLLIFALILAFGLTVSAADNKASEAEKDWDFLTFTLAPGNPPTEDVNNVYGVKVGIPIAFGDKSFVSGAELSIFCSQTPLVNGVQGAIGYNMGNIVNGLQASFVYNQAKKVNGVQFSIVNIAEEGAFQIGIVNIIKSSPLYFFPGINVKF